MAKTLSTPRKTGTHTIGRSGFAKISAVEGIRLTSDMEEMFRDFDRQGLSASERRKAIAKRYGKGG